VKIGDGRQPEAAKLGPAVSQRAERQRAQQRDEAPLLA
jgi:hypothetical protein